MTLPCKEEKDMRLKLLKRLTNEGGLQPEGPLSSNIGPSQTLSSFLSDPLRLLLGRRCDNRLLEDEGTQTLRTGLFY
ncbi:hypothetical protein MHYP_G00252960 [Metynnis hypsauchen]